MPEFPSDLDIDLYNSMSPFTYSALGLYDTLNGAEDSQYSLFGLGGAYIE